ncbi:MAG: hypothetical protein JWP34_4794 [Massilia sp.]|jgi:hypothetical protein|nr:hypothetical protein [Massilia sp.]
MNVREVISGKEQTVTAGWTVLQVTPASYGPEETRAVAARHDTCGHTETSAGPVDEPDAWERFDRRLEEHVCE